MSNEIIREVKLFIRGAKTEEFRGAVEDVLTHMEGKQILIFDWCRDHKTGVILVVEPSPSEGEPTISVDCVLRSLGKVASEVLQHSGAVVIMGPPLSDTPPEGEFKH